MPKSSMKTWTPSRRSSPSVRIARLMSSSMMLSVISNLIRRGSKERDSNSCST